MRWENLAIKGGEFIQACTLPFLLQLQSKGRGSSRQIFEKWCHSLSTVKTQANMSIRATGKEEQGNLGLGENQL